MASGKKAGRHSQQANDFLEPKAPTITGATDVGTNRAYNQGAVDVTFTLPGDSPAATSYTVYGTNGSHNHSQSGSSSPIRIESLYSNTSYTFTVVASNAAGNSVASSSSSPVLVTTVPDTAGSLSASTNGQNNNLASWSAPGQNGGKAIIDYEVSDNGGNAPDVQTTASTSITFTGQADNFSWAFRVRVRNANGYSAYTPYSNYITTTPFSFAPFGFTPFGFTPFGFTPFGFTPSKSIGADTLVHSKVPEGLVLAHNISVGDILYSAAIDDLPTSGTGLEEILNIWQSADPNINTDIETTVVAISAGIANTTFVINGNKYTNTHWIMIKRDDVAKFVPANEVLTSDLVYSPTFNDWQPVIENRVSSGSELVITINCEPYDVFFTDNALVHDSQRLEFDSPNVITDPNQSLAQSLESLYQQWKTSSAEDNNPPA
jgi:hypothetical protein